MRKTLILSIALVFLVAACAPGQSPEEVQAQIDAAVAQTVAAQNQIDEAVAQTVAAQQALATPTMTPTPTSTPFTGPPTLTPVIPTVTPFSVNPPSGSSGSGGAPAAADYSCDVIHARPYDNTEIHHGDGFDIKWTILNTGTKTWPAGYDVKYYSGPLMTTTTIIQLPEMKPKDQYNIVMDAFAPNDLGFQVMTWVVQGRLCFPYTAIIVK
jgi:hypothetical protein